MSKLEAEQVEAALIREVSGILSIDPGKIDSEIPLPELGMDSMGFVELLVIIEKAFKIRLIDSCLTRDDFRTIRSIAQRISGTQL